MRAVEPYAHDVLRVGIAILFLWFGMSQLLSPADWVSWLPAWSSAIPLSQTQLVLLNGGFETVFGAFVALGLFVRISALLLALHLFLIAFEIGYSPIGVRDLSLAVSTLSLALFRIDASAPGRVQAAASSVKPPLF